MKPSPLNKITALLLMLFLLAVGGGNTQPVIGIIDYYGFKTVSTQRAASVLHLKEGDTLFAIPESLEQKLLEIKGVKAAHVDIICCEAGKPVLFVGIAENKKDTVAWRSVHGGPVSLADTLLTKYTTYLKALEAAVKAGDNGDDFSEGYSLFHHPAVRKIQMEFIPLANAYFNDLSNVLQHSTLPRQREVAAQIIAYGSDKTRVATVLSSAVLDPSPEVRNNVFRALAGVGAYAQSHPEIRLAVNGETFVRMLNSIRWTDRDKGLFSLMSITAGRDKKLLAQLKKGALPSLVEMAAWKSSGHAVMAYVILGRTIGVPEDKIYKTWSENNKAYLLNLAKKRIPQINRTSR